VRMLATERKKEKRRKVMVLTVLGSQAPTS
jgi:hypothetical protein